MSPRPMKSRGNISLAPKASTRLSGVFVDRDTTQKNDLAVYRKSPMKRSDACPERIDISRLQWINWHFSKRIQPWGPDWFIRLHQAGIRRNDVRHSMPIRPSCKTLAISELAAKIEPAEKREDVAERRACRTAKPFRKIEFSFLAHQYRRAFSVSPGRRENKDPMHGSKPDSCSHRSAFVRSTRGNAAALCSLQSEQNN